MDHKEFSRRGGLARAAALTPEQRTKIAKKGVRAREKKKKASAVTPKPAASVPSV
jgi:hypothetical protein